MALEEVNLGRDESPDSRQAQPQGGRAASPGVFKPPSGQAKYLLKGKTAKQGWSAPGRHSTWTTMLLVNPRGRQALRLWAGNSGPLGPGQLPHDDDPGPLETGQNLHAPGASSLSQTLGPSRSPGLRHPPSH